MLGLTQARDPGALRRDRRVRRAARVHRRAGEDLFVGHVHAASASPSRSTSIPDVLLVDEVLAVGDEGFTHKCLDKFAGVQAARQDDPARHALARTSSSGSATRRCGSTTAARCRTAIPSASSAPILTKVEEGEEALLAATDGAGRWRARRARRPGGGQDGQRDRRDKTGRIARKAPSSIRLTRRRTCSRRPKDAGARARWKSPTSRSSTTADSRRSSSTPAIRSAVRVKAAGGAAGRRLRLRRRPFQRRRRLLLRDQHVSRGAEPAAPDAARPEATFAIESLDLVEGTLQAGRRRPQDRRVPR